ncbi:MAG: type II secretion system F family protein [Kiritimatiellae bacterium]|nr:type II secretion system F family protein [Kiritimatiellia bacterium]
MTFVVEAVDGGGARKTFTREAGTAAKLAAMLKDEGLLVLSVREAAEPADPEEPCREPPFWHPSWLLRMTAFDVELGLRQMAAMIKSGVTLLFALRTVADQSGKPRAARVWRKVADRVFAGGSFAEALAEQKGCFGEITVRLAEVGERSGELEFALSRAADQMEARRNLRATVVNALAYPFVAVAMTIGVSIFLVVGVIPKIADFLRSSGTDLPALTEMLMSFSEWMIANGLSVAAAIAAIAVAWSAVRFFPLGREYEDVFLLKIPVTGRILRLSGTALFARSMEIMLAAGVTLIDSLDTAAGLLSNRRLRRRVRSARESVMRGMSLAEALSPAKEFLPMLRRMAAVGEVTGGISDAFGETARFHEMMLAIAVKRFGMLIEPVMIVITAGIVGFVYIAFFLAMFAIAGAN